MNRVRPRVQIAALVKTWLLLDFFGDSRRSGDEHGSSLTTTIMWQALLSFVFAILLYPDTPLVPFLAANLSLSTLLIAIGSLGDEDRPLRVMADQNLIAGAPVRTSTVVLARALHASFQLALVTTGMALPPAILVWFLTDRLLLAVGYVAAAFACTALATAALATLRSVASRWLGSLRATLLLGTLKAALLGGGFVLFALSLRELTGTADDLPIGRAGAELLPPFHAARLLGVPGESWRIWPWLAAALAMLAITVLFGGAQAGTRQRSATRGPLLRLLGRLSATGPRRGIAEFTAVSMWRSPGFRARVLPLFGLPAGMVFLTLAGQDGERGSGFTLLSLLLQLPAIYLPFLIAFLPRADQANTGWVFDHAPGLTYEAVRDATWRALVTHVLIPIHCAAFVLVVALGPDRLDRASACVFAFGMAVLAARPMVQLDRVPFTDDHEEDRGLEIGGLMGGALVLGALGAAFGGALPAAWRWPVAVLPLTLAAMALLARTSTERGTPMAGASGAAADGVGVGVVGSGVVGSGVAGSGAVGAGAEGAASTGSRAVGAASGSHGASAGESSGVRAGEDGAAGRRAVDAAHAEAQAAAPTAPGARPAPTLARELRAVAVLYGVLCVLPWLAGAAFAA